MGYIGAGISRFNTADELTVTGDAQIDTTTLVVDSTNNRVGIGTASPTTALDVTGTVTADGLDVQGDGTISGGSRLTISNIADENNDGIRLDDSTTSRFNNLTQDSSGNFKIQHFTGSAWQNNLTVTTAGNVGIGTASPAKPLTVVGGDFSTVLLDNANASHGTQILFQANGATNSGADIQMSDAGGMKIRTLAVEPLSFHTSASAGSPSEHMRIDTSGNLLVGKTASGIANNGIELRANDDVLITKDGATALYLNRKSSDGEIIEFRKDGTGVGSIGTQNWGIGTASPSFGTTSSAGLEIAHATRGIIRLEGNSAAQALELYGDSAGGTIDARGSGAELQFELGGSEKARLASDGNLYIAKTSDTATGVGLTLSGGGFIRAVRNEICGVFNRQGSDGTLLSFSRSNSGVGAISVTTSGTTYNTTSDIRLKQDIKPLEATDKLMAMNPVSYSWKADPDGPRSMGFIAQEMEEVMPEAVSTGEDDDAMMSMDYGRITPILVSALQDAHRKIEELAAEIAELKAS